MNEQSCSTSPSEITWNRFVTSHSSSSPSVLRMTFIPEANCNFSSSFTRVFTAARVNGFFVVSQQASALMLFKPKNKFPFESIAEAADCEPLGPRILKAFAYEFSSASHAVRLCSALSGTAFSCSEASEWKYSARFSPRLLFSTATPNIPSISSNDSPDIECVPNVGYGYINSGYRKSKKEVLMYFQFTLAVREPQARYLNSFCYLHALVGGWLPLHVKLSTPLAVSLGLAFDIEYVLFSTRHELSVHESYTSIPKAATSAMYALLLAQWPAGKGSSTSMIWRTGKFKAISRNWVFSLSAECNQRSLLTGVTKNENWLYWAFGTS